MAWLGPSYLPGEWKGRGGQQIVGSPLPFSGHPGPMDQGIAAAFAGVAGLLGAAIGGFAAVWGARVSAETTARATAQQVRDQAEVDHGQWLREQRLVAYRNLLVAYDKYSAVASALSRDLEPGTSSSPGPESLSVGGAADAVTQAYNEVRLVGPDDVRDAAEGLWGAVYEHSARLGTQQGAFFLGNDGEERVAREESERSMERCGSAHRALVAAVTHVVEGRPAVPGVASVPNSN